MARYCYLFEEVLFSVIIYSIQSKNIKSLSCQKLRKGSVIIGLMYYSNKCIKKITKKYYITSFKTALTKKFISLLNFFHSVIFKFLVIKKGESEHLC